MRVAAVALLTLGHEVAWLVYIRAIAGRRFWRATIGNGAILLSGGLLTYFVARNPVDILVMAVAGMAGTSLFWRLSR